MRSIKFAKHKILLIPLSMLAVTLIAGYFLSHIPLGANAVTTSDVSLRVKDTCTMDGNVVTDDSNMLNGQEREGFHVLSLTTYCNDNAGFSIYAVGYSGDLEGSTDLTGVTTGLTISTADWADRNTGDNATKSIYSLKIEKDTASYLPGNISILNGFTNYLAVPSTNTKVASYSSNTDTTTGSTINASYAVKVANLQAADTYTGKVKYTMVHPSSNSATGFTFDDAFQLAGKSRVSGTSYFAMQDMNAAICNKVTESNNNFPETQLIDTRDNNIYTIKKINGDCWMTQNLRFTGTTLTPADSNVSANTTMAYYSLDSNDASYTDHCDSTNGYNYACIKDSGNDTTGVWYNYAAASAGTIATDDNTTASNYSVCPKGWHIPTGAAADTSSEFYKIFQNTTAGSWVAANDYTNAFKAVAGGDYNNGSLGSTGYGYWWSATASNATGRYYLSYSGSHFSSSYANRYYGYFVRCIADNSMQTFDSTAAASLAINESLQLRDVRDGKEYWVTKLADGNVWMTQNLDFDITGPLDSTTTNLTVSGEAPYTTGYTKDNTTGIITWTPDSSLYTISAPAINQSFTWSNNYNNPESVDLGDWYYRSDYYNSGDCGDLGCNYHTGNAGDQFSQTPGANGTHSHVGNYYSWSAAVASSDISGYNSGNAANSLCPANWNLPVNGMYGTLNTLYNNGLEGDQTGGNADKNLLAAPLYFVRAGGVWSSTLRYAGTLGVYWSSTVYSSSFAHHLYFHSSGVWTAGKLNGYDGWSLRCVVDDSMQSFDQDAAASLAINESLTLRDSRDNQEYTVAKLKDGKVWMTKNLNLAGGTTITPADSDVAENYTLPTSSTTGFDNDDASHAYVYNSPNNTDSCGSGCYSYYSYNAATASSGVDIATDNTDAPYSICPAGWRLPTSRSTVALAQGTPGSDFYKMAIHYGLKDSVVNEDPDNDGMNFCTLGGDCGTNTIPRFLRAGRYYGSTFYYGGANGYYWSSTASSSAYAHDLYFYSGDVYSAGNSGRRDGFSVRCLLRTE